MEHELETGRIVYVGDLFAIYDISDLLPQHPNYPHGANHIINPRTGRSAVHGAYYDIVDRQIQELWVHQTYGSCTPGIDGVKNTAAFFIRDPEWTLNADGVHVWTGTGRGWPGFAYTYFCPFQPWVYEDRPVVFQCNPLDRVSWHTSGHNRTGVSLVFQGRFWHRSMTQFRPLPGTDGRPSDMQLQVFDGFLPEYAEGVLGIPPQRIGGHFEAGKPKCPGDVLEHRVLRYRKSATGAVCLDYRVDGFEVARRVWLWRQAVLVYLGQNLGTYGPHHNGVDGQPGELTRLAIEDMEQRLGLPVDGSWDDLFDEKVREVLRAMQVVPSEIEKIIHGG